jgi:hypothetical protein
MGWLPVVVIWACLQMVVISGGITYQSSIRGTISSSFGVSTLSESG